MMRGHPAANFGTCLVRSQKPQQGAHASGNGRVCSFHKQGLDESRRSGAADGTASTASCSPRGETLSKPLKPFVVFSGRELMTPALFVQPDSRLLCARKLHAVAMCGSFCARSNARGTAARVWSCLSMRITRCISVYSVDTHDRFVSKTLQDLHVGQHPITHGCKAQWFLQ